MGRKNTGIKNTDINNANKDHTAAGGTAGGATAGGGSVSLPRVMIAAASSGSGKTLISCGLLKVFKDDGLDPVAYKCGPDYIDPMFHKRVLGIDSINLDPYLAGRDGVKRCVMSAAKDGDHVAVMEGVMGIYDGSSPSDTASSCYETARITDTPVILVVDAHGIGRTVISVIKGILIDDGYRLIKGVIINRMSDGFYETARPYIEQEIGAIRDDVRLVGHIPRKEGIHIESRHLGLVRPYEIEDMNEQIGLIGGIIREKCDIAAIRNIMNGAPKPAFKTNDDPSVTAFVKKMQGEKPVNVAVAMDEAFCFYYSENLRLLETMGAKLCYFSPVRDEAIPDDADALLFGGGYPELALSELSQNRSMLSSVRNAVLVDRLPTLAECGGFMYMHRSIKGDDGRIYDMAGVINGRCHDTNHLVRFGYVRIEECVAQSGLGRHFAGMRGHEYHYYDSHNGGKDMILCKPNGDRKYRSMIATDTYVIGWMHMYYPSDPGAIAAFLDKAVQIRRERS